MTMRIITMSIRRQPLNDSQPLAVSLVECYCLPPSDIEAASLAQVRALTPELEAMPEGERLVTRRMIYACGDPSIAAQIRIHPRAVAAGVTALRAGATVVTDVRMVEAGLDRTRLGRLGCAVACLIDDAEIAARARAAGLPRAVLAMRALQPALDGAVVVIGNAPTALLALLDLADAAEVRPAVIIGLPVGFVAAAESKDELVARPYPFITLVGRRGGSPLAAAAANALLRLAAP